MIIVLIYLVNHKLLQRHEEQYHAHGVGQTTVTPACATPMTETPTPLGQKAENTACDLAAIWRLCLIQIHETFWQI